MPNCITLSCGDNKLINLPELPACELLFCDSNQLTILPELPNCQTLWCRGNKIATIPKLPNCNALKCDNNRLIFLPQMPKCDSISYHGNKYLYINPKIKVVKKNNLELSPNYNKNSIKIQKLYKKFMRKKYLKQFTEFNILYKDVANICTHYII